MHRSELKNCLYLLLILLIPSFSFAQSFEEKASFYGIHCSYGDSAAFGGGISAYDFNHDGLDDLTIATDARNSILFYENTGSGFQQVSFSGISDSFQTKQISWVDYDNDGDPDLFASSSKGQNVLYINDGQYTFSKYIFQKSQTHSDTSIASYGATFGDFNQDGYLDLYITHYDSRAAVPNQLWMNDGLGGFTEVTSSSVFNGISQRTFCSSLIDFNNDLNADIYTAEDRATINRLFENSGNGSFTDVSATSGADVVVNAMGIAIGDYDMDQDLDIYVSNTPEGNPMLRNNGNGTFTRVDSLIGVSYNRVSWGVNFIDFDNDMDLDLYVSGSTDIDRVQSQLFENDGTGMFQGFPLDSLPGDSTLSFSNAIGDFDNDGFPDIVVNNKGPDSVMLWQNLRSGNNWLKIELEGNVSNRDGIGAWIEVFVAGKVLVRYKGNAISFVSQNSGSEMFGLGQNATVDSVKVSWPSGMVDVLENVNGNRSFLIVEGSTLVSVPDGNSILTEIWPQPASTKLFLRIPKDEALIDLKIFDIHGRYWPIDVVIESNQQAQLNCRNCNGIYFLEIITEKGKYIKKAVFTR